MFSVPRISESELRALLEEFLKDDRARGPALAFVFGTGLAPGRVLRVRSGDVDLRELRVRFRDSGDRVCGETIFPEELLPVLRVLYSEDEDAPLFAMYGRPVSIRALQNYAKDVCGRLGVGSVTPMGLSLMFVDRLVRRRIDPEFVARCCGRSAGWVREYVRSLVEEDYERVWCWV